ncbi:MAG TPA: FG-GAP-like repeat-containing protein [Candidatus Dormibacteraeota bacterium]|nr:FG-GAP-like repeat-containing protein [Candidatus Dormibacteraeota bacterium]
MAVTNRMRFALLGAFLAGACPVWSQAPANSPSGSGPPQLAIAPQPAVKPDTHRAKRAYQLGLRAEQSGDWSTAFEAYTEAAMYAPSDVEILRHKELARFRLVSLHTDAAERYAVAGKFGEASEELRTALRLDPGYSVALERLAQFSKLTSSGDQANAAALAGPVELKPQPGTRNFNLRGETRSAYSEVARQFGLTVAFDGDLPSHPVQLRVNDVDFPTVMILLEDQTGTFWRPVSDHLLFVTANTTEKRKEYAPVVERTIELPDTISLEQLTELQRVVREIVGIAHSQISPATHTITVRDTPKKVTLAAELMRQVQQSRGEVMLEIELLEVDRAAALSLGVTPPTKAQLLTVNQSDLTALQKAPDLAALLAIIQRILGRSGTLGGLNSSQLASLIGSGQLAAGALIPPIVAIGGGRSTVLATVPQAAIDFSQEFNLLRSGRRMLLRASDGQPASFFIGDRFPVALATLSASLASSQSIPAISGTSLPRTDYPVGKGPIALFTADFNGDGSSDLAVVNRDDNTVSILLNNGSGSFASGAGSPIALGAGQVPVALVGGVFNENSGRMDLAVVNKGSGNLTILQGDGKGGFQAAGGPPIAVGASPTAVAAGTFNTKNDVHLDLAIANSQDNTITILLGDGKGNFTAAPGSPLKLAGSEQSPIAIITKDFNLDGKADLAVVNQTSNNVAILLGNGDGTFREAPGSPIAVRKSPVAIASADFDGDTHPDLAIVNQGDASVTILLDARGDGSFTAVNSLLATGATPDGAVSGDFNFDGRADLIVANSGSNTVSVFFGLGGGFFSQPVILQTGATPRGPVSASFTRSGRADLAVADQGSNQVSVILNLLSIPGGNNIAQQPFPGAEYLDLGLKVKATPRLHSNDEVSLQLLFEIRHLAGSALNGIPIISNRTIEQSVRLRENETTIISGMLERDEVRSISGLPGLSPIPIGGVLAGKLRSRPRDSELIIMITPRQLRLIPAAGRALYAGRGDEPTPHGGGEGVQPQPSLPPQPRPGMPQPIPQPPQPRPTPPQ